MLNSTDFSPVLNCQDADTAASNLVNIISSVVDDKLCLQHGRFQFNTSEYKVDTALLDYLKANRSVNPLKKTINKKVSIVEPGASVSSEEIENLMSKKPMKERKLNKKGLIKKLKAEALNHTSGLECEFQNAVPSPEPIMNQIPELDSTSKSDKTHDIYSSLSHTPKRSHFKPENDLILFDHYNPVNPVASTSTGRVDLTLSNIRKRKLAKKITHIKKRLLEEETDVGSDDEYSLRESSDDGTLIPTLEESDTVEELETHNLEKTTQSSSRNMVEKQINSFLLVRFRGHKTNKFYVGQILELTENSGMLVKFMRRRKADLFYWPDVNDASFILESDVELVLTNPREGRRGTFKFEDIDYSKYNVQ
ncbi:unnamed protein product [Arctia plantaginis]|uniref:Uncharacterized protein n=1 Tax=Arctia plantaginis TaxID=874455 RepID=A0A8S1B8L4_ARCPL|nr:unnamed protein product [Arctia plantaginis]